MTTLGGLITFQCIPMGNGALSYNHLEIQSSSQNELNLQLKATLYIPKPWIASILNRGTGIPVFNDLDVLWPVKKHLIIYLRRLSRPGSNGRCGFFGLFAHVLKVVLPYQSLWPASSEDWAWTEFLIQSSEDAGRRDWRNVRKNNLQNTGPKSPENPQQPSDSGHESLREY